MSRIYFYKLMVDNLGAPHVSDNLLTLAICKPGIRRNAQIDDLIFGFGGQELSERLIYAAVITEIADGPEYYSIDQNRSDAIYSWTNGGYQLRNDALYHSDGTRLENDVGSAPYFLNARVLVSRDFRYFGKSGDTSFKSGRPFLTERLASLAQGHRVNHAPELRRELIDLKEWLWTISSPTPIAASNPVPTLENPCRACNGDEDDYEETPDVC